MRNTITLLEGEEGRERERGGGGGGEGGEGGGGRGGKREGERIVMHNKGGREKREGGSEREL